MLSASSPSAACGSCKDATCVTTRQPQQHLPPVHSHSYSLSCTGDRADSASNCPGCMDTMPTHRHLLPRNFSCTAVLYGDSPENLEDDEDDDDGEELADKSKEQSKPVTRGREVSLAPQSPTARRRAKSLPTPAERRHLEVVAPRKKVVRFADSLGLELTSVRHYSNADLPRVPHHVLAGLRCGEACPAGAELSALLFRPVSSSFYLDPLFTNPGTKPDFLDVVRQRRVCLESLHTDPFSITGELRVLNLSYEKEVVVRYTVDSWKTSNEILAGYQRGFSDRYTDKFSFKLLCPALLNKEGFLEFAIRYRVCGAEYWDNNDGHNYKVKSQRATVSPPKELDSAWIHFI
ncbi:protein phosphatase 1 regulatory subunit 3E-like [Spea bombifrons]|uniref:protein phosphatase 1 regulatory subunit 3E-like n=1 Tax=Spea bombifrons TaxID=233779 RepID=UPI0023492A60|nr:protein phosphatase 1 regulatory subunit 3E-like [Spea bombifrons]